MYNIGMTYATDAQLTFDYDVEIPQAFTDYPRLRRNTFFMRVDERKNTTLSTDGKFRKKYVRAMDDDVTALDISRDVGQIAGGGGLAHRFDGDGLFTHMYGLFLNPAFLPGARGPEDAAIARAYVFFHELGHRLVPGGLGWFRAEEKLEARADAFAAINLLARFGDRGRAYLERCRDWMSARCVDAGDVSHMTLDVIDKILEDGKTTDFSAMTPKQKVKAALHYGRKYALQSEDAETLHSNCGALSGGILSPNAWREKRLDWLAETCLQTPHLLSFRVGAYFFRALLAGEMQGGGETVLLPPEKTSALRAQFAARAEELGLPDIREAFLKAAPRAAVPVYRSEPRFSF